MFISENYADIPEPLEILFPAVIPGQAYNYNGYNNPTVTSDLSQAIKEPNDPKRASLVLSAQATLANDLAALPLANPAVPLFLNKRITGAPPVLLPVLPVGTRLGGPRHVRIAAFIAGRLAGLAATLLVMSFIVYAALYLLPAARSMSSRAGARSRRGNDRRDQR